MRRRRITSCKSEDSRLTEKVIFPLSLSAEVVALRATLSSGAPRHLLSKEGFQKGVRFAHFVSAFGAIFYAGGAGERACERL